MDKIVFKVDVLSRYLINALDFVPYNRGKVLKALEQNELKIISNCILNWRHKT